MIAPPVVLATLLSPKLAKFARDDPDVMLDITGEDDTRGDLVAGRFDLERVRIPLIVNALKR